MKIKYKMKDLTKKESENKEIKIKNEKLFFSKKYSICLYVILCCISAICIALSFYVNETKFSNLLISFGTSLLSSSILGYIIERIIKKRDKAHYFYYRDKSISKINYHMRILLEQLVRDYSALFSNFNIKLNKLSFNVIDFLEICMSKIKENDSLNISIDYSNNVNNLNESIVEYLTNPFVKESKLFISQEEYELFNCIINEILFCFRNDNIYTATENIKELIERLSSIKELKKIKNLKVIKINKNYIVSYSN